MYRTPTLLLCTLLIALAACAGPAPTAAPGERATTIPLPTAAAWIEPATPVTLASIDRLRQLGTLDAAQPPSTVFAYALSLDQTLLAGLNNESLMAWSLVTGERLYQVPHLLSNRVYFSPEKDELLTLDNEARINIINAETGVTQATLNGHPQFDGSAAYLPLEGLLALSGSDGTFKVWDVIERLSLVTQPTGLELAGLAFSSDGRLLAAAGSNGTVQLWDLDVRGGAPVLTLETLEPVSALLFSPDDRYLVTTSPDAAAVWETASGQLARRLNTGGFGDVFRFVPNSPYLLTNSGTPELLIWDIEQGQVAAVVNRQGQDRLTVALSPDSVLLYVAELGVGATLWSLENLADGSVGRSTRAVNNSTTLFNVVWTEDSFAVLFFDTRGSVEVWGVGTP